MQRSREHCVTFRLIRHKENEQTVFRIVYNLIAVQRLTSFYKKYSASPFVRNVSKLTGGTALAQLVSLATAPVLYRMYDKEFYGTLGVFMAITGVLGAFSHFQYIQAVILEKEDKDALQSLWLWRTINLT